MPLLIFIVIRLLTFSIDDTRSYAPGEIDLFLSDFFKLYLSFCFLFCFCCLTLVLILTLSQIS